MNVKTIVVFCCALAATALPVAAAGSKPNILVIVADDMGYTDCGVQGCKDVATPNIDSLAKNGVRFTNGYVSGCVCSPSRVGIVTGRYQQRTGHDANPHGKTGLDLKEATMAQRMKAAGYATGIMGKWHLGEEKEQMPPSRGFDEFYGILPHGIGAERKGGAVQVWRGFDKAETPTDHTVKFGEEAEAFIERHKSGPWYLYLPFTAVHAPHVAPESYVKKFAHIEDKGRRHLCAMISVMDDRIGTVLAKLRELKLEENTLIFFISDNGGPSSRAVHNGPLHGGKWTVWEGGIRVPFMVQWKGRIAPGRVLDTPVIQLDFLPTALAAASVNTQPEWKIDGVNLLPLLEGKTDKLQRDALFWRFGVQFAVRQGDWKLVKASRDMQPALFNVTADIGEKSDLAAQQPEKVKQLQALWDSWNAQNIPPRWDDQRWNGLEEKATNKQLKKGKSKKGKKQSQT
ncbi:MAG: sulfatase [Verrucomicrobia bacterium]|nr:sulfatase [Verrucomicrobiota bacterium]